MANLSRRITDVLFIVSAAAGVACVYMLFAALFHLPAPWFLPSPVLAVLEVISGRRIWVIGAPSILLVLCGLGLFCGASSPKRKRQGAMLSMLGMSPAAGLILLWLLNFAVLVPMMGSQLFQEFKVQRDLRADPETLLMKIRNAGWEERLSYIVAMDAAETPDPSWIGPLRVMLDDSDTHVGEEAANLIAKFGPAAAPAVDDLARNLARVYGAEHALSKIGPAALPVLTQALRSDSSRIRIHALAGLKGMGPGASPAVPEIEALLSDPDLSVAEAARYALTEIRKGEVSSQSNAPSVE